jgi:multicomponent Na+:H+ antiporter subunit D
VFLIVGSSLIALVYVGRVLETFYLREPAPALADVTDPPLSMMLPMLAMTAAVVYFGISTEWTAGVAATAAQALLGGLR